MPANKKYGVYIGRFQPRHLGHEYLPDAIRKDGLTPVCLIGSANESGTEKNPLLASVRAQHIKAIDPDAIIGFLNDSYSNTLWLKQLKDELIKVSEDLNEFVIYTHNKPEDRYDFTYDGIEYKNEYYSKMFEVAGFSIKDLPPSNVDVSATQIRSDIERYKEFLHPDVYKDLKNRGW